MKRKLASLLLCGALSLSVLTGCGGSNEESTVENDVKTIFTYAIGGDTGNTLNTFTADDITGLREAVPFEAWKTIREAMDELTFAAAYFDASVSADFLSKS